MLVTASSANLISQLLTVVMELSSRGQEDLAGELLKTVQLLTDGQDPKSVIEVLGDLRDALNQNGLPCPWSIKGWGHANHTKYRDMAFDDGLTVREDNTHLVWTIGIDGSGTDEVKYIPYKHKGAEGKDVVLHKPENPEVLIPKIQNAFQGLGFSLIDVIPSSHSPYNSYIIIYNVATQWPDFLKRN